ncbi:MAG: FtsX-like permease family protein [Phycisphaerae bacterium]|nr:FtsX-like permease family protein [Phycisphaerae bacterium]
MALPLSYNWRNLLVRKLSTTLTFVVVAVIVFVLAVLLSFAAGIQASLAITGSNRNVLVLAKGATSESTSIILPAEAARLPQTPGVARAGDGRLMLSEEINVQTLVPRRDPGDPPAAVAVRGVDAIAFDVHSAVTIVEGRSFESGALEVIVGVAAERRFADLNIGDDVTLGRNSNRQFRIVGLFTAGGSALESEIWAPRTIVADVYDRRIISSALMRIAPESSVEAAIEYVRGPTVELAAKTETDYYEDLTKKTQEIVTLTVALVTLMAVGAVFAVANTMYAAVDRRRREIAMLRTLGFDRWSVVISFLLESVMICVPAAAAGLLGSLAFSGRRQDFLSEYTWTVLAYELKVTPEIVASALILAVIVAVAGAAAPALRASRTNVLEALRKA